MNNELQDKLASIIEKGESVAPEIAREIINQGCVAAILLLIGSSVFIGAAITATIFFNKRGEDRYRDWDDALHLIFPALIGYFFGILLFLHGAYKMCEIYLWPNSYILHSIMGS